MASHNSVKLIGHLTRDVEIRQAGDTTIANFGLAVNDVYTDKDGKKQENVNFIDCEIFGKKADTFAKYTHKGSQVFLDGSLKQDRWEDKTSGDKRSKIVIKVFNYQFLDPLGPKESSTSPNQNERNDSRNENNRTPNTKQNQSKSSYSNNSNNSNNRKNEDIPF